MLCWFVKDHCSTKTSQEEGASVRTFMQKIGVINSVLPLLQTGTNPLANTTNLSIECTFAIHVQIIDLGKCWVQEEERSPDWGNLVSLPLSTVYFEDVKIQAVVEQPPKNAV